MRKSKKIPSKKEIEVVYEFVDCPDAEQRLNRAFDVLFEAVFNEEPSNKGK